MIRYKLLPLVALILLLTGCAPSEVVEAKPYYLYFQEADLSAAAGGDVLREEALAVEESEKSQQEIARILMEGLLTGPADGTLRNTIPAGTGLLSLEIEKGQANVDLSAPYGVLSGVNLTLADYAITMTLTQLSDIYSVHITVNGRELIYRDRQVFRSRDILLSPQEDVVGVLQTVLYFPDETGTLMPEHRTLELYEGDTQVSVVLQTLEEPPQTKGLMRAQPEGFWVSAAWLEDNVCYVNLASNLLGGATGLPTLDVAIQALARSLCTLDTVQEVRFLVDGEYAKRYGAADISQAFTEAAFLQYK